MDTELTVGRALLAICSLTLLPISAFAQSQEPPVRIVVPTVTVTAQKEPADVQTLPLSVTAISKDTIAGDGIAIISDAGIFAPNTYFSEFSARKLSFPHFRGISSGPGNPAITTYIDGVPQLHTNSSSVDLLDIDQVELVRGAQSALFGRNALGGLVNVVSARPSIQKWTGAVVAPFGNFGAKEIRGAVSGPVADGLAISLAAGRSERDGYTTNDVSGRPLDNARPHSAKFRCSGAHRPTGRLARSSTASAPATATMRSTTWERCAPILFMPREILKATRIAT